MANTYLLTYLSLNHSCLHSETSIKTKNWSVESCLVGERMDVLRRRHAWGGDGRSTPLPPIPCPVHLYHLTF